MTYRTTIRWWVLSGVLAGLAQTGCDASADFTAPPRVASVDRLSDIIHRHTVRVVPGMSLQAAVDAVGAGGTVLIESGVYRDSVVVTAPGVRLRGLDGGEGEGVVIENPGGADNGIHVTATGRDFVLENVTFADSTRTASSWSASMDSGSHAYVRSATGTTDSSRCSRHTA